MTLINGNNNAISEEDEKQNVITNSYITSIHQNGDCSNVDNENDGLQLHKRTMKRRNKCCSITISIIGVFIFLIGFSWLLYTPFRFFMEERLRMTPGLPPFEWWKNPEPEVRLRAFIFTVTNADNFLEGRDKKMHVKEFGPIVYREKLEHRDIEFHENSTMSYTIHRYLEFLPEHNRPGILNETVLVPNIVLLGMATLASQWGAIGKMGFRIASTRDSLFVNTTVYNYLWNSSTEALDSIKKYVPAFLIPQDNGGALHNVYQDFNDRVNVKMGLKYGFKEFFQINTFNGRPTVPGFHPEEGDCFASLANSTEGAMYPNFLSKDTVIYYWRKTVCRPVPLYFAEEVEKGMITAYKYETHTSMYDRFEDLDADCYKYRGEDILPDGLSDISKCYNDMPVVISAPHFYGRDGFWNDQLEGFTPNKKDHGSYAIIEPITGVPIEQCARSQSSMYMPKLYGLNEKLHRFSEKLIPMIWMEYHQEKLTPTIDAMIIFTVKVLPVLQYVLSGIFIVFGAIIAFFPHRRTQCCKTVQTKNKEEADSLRVEQ